jgi:hypothetical protein
MTELSQAAVERIIKKAGAERVSAEATETLTGLMEEYGAFPTMREGRPYGDPTSGWQQRYSSKPDVRENNAKWGGISQKNSFLSRCFRTL